MSEPKWLNKDIEWDCPVCGETNVDNPYLGPTGVMCFACLNPFDWDDVTDEPICEEELDERR